MTTEEQKDEFLAQLSAAEDWLYMDGADATAQVFEEKLKELEAFGIFLVADRHASISSHVLSQEIPFSSERLNLSIDHSLWRIARRLLLWWTRHSLLGLK